MSCRVNMFEYPLFCYAPLALAIYVHLVMNDFGDIEAEVITQIEQNDDDIGHFPSIQGALGKLGKLFLKLLYHLIPGAIRIYLIAPFLDQLGDLPDIVWDISFRHSLPSHGSR